MTVRAARGTNEAFTAPFVLLDVCRRRKGGRGGSSGPGPPGPGPPGPAPGPLRVCNAAGNQKLRSGGSSGSGLVLGGGPDVQSGCVTKKIDVKNLLYFFLLIYRKEAFLPFKVISFQMDFEYDRK